MKIGAPVSVGTYIVKSMIPVLIGNTIAGAVHAHHHCYCAFPGVSSLFLKPANTRRRVNEGAIPTLQHVICVWQV